MACAEIGLTLPPVSSEITDSHSISDITKEETEKNDDSRSSIAQEDSSNVTHGDIVWHYLEFETELPSPNLAQPNFTPNEQTPPPECPNLKKYTSPFLWSRTRKNFMVLLSCLVTVIAAYNAGAYSPGVQQMSEEWNKGRVAVLVGITTFTVGFGIAPMFLAPFSELNGRRPVFVASGILFVIFQIVCAFTPTYAGMIVARFLTGCMSSTFSTMVGGVVSDIYHAEDRNTAMTLFSAAALFGTGFGPFICGFIAYRTTWRWIFYHQIIFDGVLIVFVVLFFKETRGSVLLSRKAKALNKWYDSLEEAGYYGVIMRSPPESENGAPRRIRWKVKADEERTSLLTMIKISLHRPFHMLITEPVVTFFSLWISFSWGVLYMTLPAVPLIFQTTYGFNLEQSGAVFAAISIGSILFTLVAIYQESVLRDYLPAKHQAILETPEGRLYFACVESALLPIGCIWFGVTGAYPSIPWIVPALGIACATMGIFSIYLAVFNYLADSYHRYASSALAAQSFCRNMLGGAFPLFTTQMFNTMTFQGAGGFLGGLGFLLTIVPWVLLLYGPQIRARSKLASEITNH